jgi:chromosome segregation ATPase
MRAALNISLLLLLVSAGTMAQQPSQCEVKVSSLQAQVAAEKLKSETIAARVESLERELAKQKGLTSDAEQRAGTEQKNAEGSKTLAATLASSNATAQKTITGLEMALIESRATAEAVNAQLNIRTDERDTARDEARRARSWKRSFARIFGVK